MRLILKCVNPSGSVACPAGLIDGLPVPERHYQIVENQLVLEGPDYIVHHDADDLLAQGVLFRMLTPKEQKALVQEAEQASLVEESAAPEQPPALSDLKKQSGG